MVALAFVRAGTVGIGAAALIRSSNLQRSTVLALQFSTEQLAVGRRLEVVVVAEGAVVGERHASALFGVVIVSEHTRC